MHPVPHGRPFLPRGLVPWWAPCLWVARHPVCVAPSCLSQAVDAGWRPCLFRAQTTFRTCFLVQFPAPQTRHCPGDAPQATAAALGRHAMVTRGRQRPSAPAGSQEQGGQGPGSGPRVAFRGPGGDREASARLQEQRGGHRAGAWPPSACGKHRAGWGSSGTRAAGGGSSAGAPPSRGRTGEAAV